MTKQEYYEKLETALTGLYELEDLLQYDCPEISTAINWLQIQLRVNLEEQS